MCLQLVLVRSGIWTPFLWAFQLDITVFLNDVTLQAILSDGGIVALGTVMQMFSRMCSHMYVKVYLVPVQLTCLKKDPGFTYYISEKLTDLAEQNISGIC